MAEQIAALVAVNEGMLDGLPLARVREAETAIREAAIHQQAGLCERVAAGEKLSDDDLKTLADTARTAVEASFPKEPDPEAAGAEEQAVEGTGADDGNT